MALITSGLCALQDPARSLLVSSLSKIVDGGGAKGAAGRVASSISSLTDAPAGELADSAVDSSLNLVGSVAGNEALDPTAVAGFGKTASNLLKATKSLYVEARRRRRLAEADGNATNATDAESAVARQRSAGVLSVINAVAKGCTSDQVPGEAATVVKTDTFALQAERQEADGFAGKTIGPGIALPAGLFDGKHNLGAVDSQITEWGADDSPFFYANEAGNSTLTTPVISVSFGSGGAELEISGLVSVRDTAFPCTPAATLPKTNAFAGGAAGRPDRSRHRHRQLHLRQGLQLLVLRPGRTGVGGGRRGLQHD